MRGVTWFFVAGCIAAAAAPLLGARHQAAIGSPAFPGWPVQWEGRALEPLPLSDQEVEFEASFPGRIGRFRVAREPGELVLRWVHSPSRRVHPARHCYRGAGFAVVPTGLFIAEDGRSWSRFVASRGDERIEVREIILGEGRTWPDIESWYWEAEEAQGQWWVVTRSIPHSGGRPSQVDGGATESSGKVGASSL